MSELRKHVADGSCRKKKDKKRDRHTTSDDDDFVDMRLQAKKTKKHSAKREEYDDIQS
jgi:hypothetical protein